MRDQRISNELSHKAEQSRSAGRSWWAGSARCEPLEPRRLLALAVHPRDSLPGAPVTLLIDFDGNPAFTWNNNDGNGDYAVHGPGPTNTPLPAYDVDGDPTSFNAQELDEMDAIWAYVAEKYSPFRVNVTTVDSGFPPTVRVIVGGSPFDWYGQSNGGVADIGGYGSSPGNTAYVWPIQTNPLATPGRRVQFISESVAHEAGHEFGLTHERTPDGKGGLNEYYPGDNNVVPIMGGSNNASGPRSIWWKTNVYPGQNSPDSIEDELAVLTGPGRPLRYRQDDYPALSPPDDRIPVLSIDSGGVVLPASGVIEDKDDVDSFIFRPTTAHAKFVVNDGSPSTLLPPSALVGNALLGGMLAPDVTITDAATGNPAGGNVVKVTNTSASVEAFALTPGHPYYLNVTSQGGYGDIGQYTITGLMDTFAFYNPNFRQLYVGGLPGNNNLRIFLSGTDQIEVSDSVNGGGTGFQTFKLSDIDEVLVLLGGGDDTVTVEPLFQTFPFIPGPLVVVGGNGGNNTLKLNASTGGRFNNAMFDVTGSIIGGNSGISFGDPAYHLTRVLYGEFGRVDLAGGALISNDYHVHSWGPFGRLYINGDAHADNVTIDSDVADHAGSLITFDGGAPGGRNTLTIDDTANNGGFLEGGPEDQHFTPKTFSVSSIGVFSNAVGGVREFDYANVNELNLKLGRGVALGEGPSVFVDEEAAGMAINVYGNNNDLSTNHFYVGSTDPHGFPELSSPFSGTIHGDVWFYGAFGNNLLTIDDRDFAAPTTYTLNSRSITSSAGGGTVHWNDTSFSSVDFFGRNGGSNLVVNAYESFVPVHLHGGTGGVDALAVDDRVARDATPGRIDFFADRVTRVFPESTPVTFTYDGYESAAFYLNAEENTANIFSVPAFPQGQQLTAFGGAGADTFNVYPRDAAGNVTIPANVGIFGGGGSDALNLSDTAAPAGTTWTINNPFGADTQSYSVTGSGLIGAFRDLESTIVSGSGGADTINLDSYKSGTALRINAGGGDDTLNFGNGSLTANVTSISAFTFDGQGGSDVFNLNDTNDLAGTYTRANGSIAYAATFAAYVIGLSDLNTESMQVFPARSNPDLRVVSTEAGTTTAFRLGTAANGGLRVGSLVNTLGELRGAVIFDGGTNGSQVTINDQGDAAGRVVHVTSNSVGAVPGDTLFPAGGSLSFSNVVAGFVPGLTLSLGGGPDTVYAQPNATGSVSINAGNPTAAPGDVLNLALAAAQNYALHGTAASGSVTSANLKTLNYSGFEAGPNVDAVAPQVVGANINLGNGGAAIASVSPAAAAPQSLDVQFSEDVFLLNGPGSIELVNNTTGQAVSPADVSVDYDPSTRTAHFTFPGYPGGILPDGDYHARVLAGSVADGFGNAMAADAPFDFTVRTQPPPATVAGRYAFYNASSFDGGDPAANAADDGAIALDKLALLPGQTPAAANVTSYLRGLNGVMVDISGLAPGEALGADDFAFESLAGGVWTPLAATPAVTVRRGEGAGGSDRVTLTWSEGAVRNGWLRVTALANAHTRLAQDDVFAFGNLAGETGDALAPFRVNALDLAAVKQHLNESSPVTGRFDFNRDGRVNALDLATVRGNLNRSLAAIPATAPPLPAAARAPSFPIFSVTREILA